MDYTKLSTSNLEAVRAEIFSEMQGTAFLAAAIQKSGRNSAQEEINDVLLSHVMRLDELIDISREQIRRFEEARNVLLATHPELTEL